MRPAKRSVANRRLHVRTVSVHTPTSAAIRVLALPAAAPNTIRARTRSRCSVRTDRARAAKTASSASDRTITCGLDIDIGSLCQPNPETGERHAVIAVEAVGEDDPRADVPRVDEDLPDSALSLIHI